jgi:hypothetical protein
MSDRAVWLAPAPGSIAWRRFGDDLVLYDDATGCTHHLGPLGSAVFVALAEHECGLELAALVDYLSADEDFSTAATFAAQVERTVLDLADLNLATRASA